MDESAGANLSEETARPAGRDEVIAATVRAAADLFAQRNPSQVSVREIAAAAGVSHALVHRYLGSKDDIFHAALEFDRRETAEYWMGDHGMSSGAPTFDATLPPGRYVRTVMRAALDGMPMSEEDMKFPHADRMMEFLSSPAFHVPEGEPDFDIRLLFSAALAMMAGMAIAGEFFLVQSGLQDEDPTAVQSELNRLVLHVMGLAKS